MKQIQCSAKIIHYLKLKKMNSSDTYLMCAKAKRRTFKLLSSPVKSLQYKLDIYLLHLCQDCSDHMFCIIG